MICAACSKGLQEASVEYAGKNFCDNLCRYTYKKQLESSGVALPLPVPSKSSSKAAEPVRVHSARDPVDSMAIHIAMGIGLLFLLITRYVVYVEQSTAGLNIMRAIGANTAYFMIWALAYTIAFATPRPRLNTVLGLLATVIAPITTPITGFSILVGMYIIRRKQVA